MTSTGLRIAVSGFPGTGKTSLVNALSKKFKIPIIRENMMDLSVKSYAEDMLIRTYGGERSLEHVRRFVDAFVLWDADRTRQYSVNGSFVADRWEADLLEMFLLTFIYGGEPVETTFPHLLKNYQQKAKIFDLVILTPLLPPFAEDKNENGISRVRSLSRHVLNMSVMLGLMQNFATVPIFPLPNTPLSVEERVNLIAAHLEKIRAGTTTQMQTS